MKLNRINTFLGDSGYKSPWLSYAAIYILLLLISACVVVSGRSGTSFDTPGYFEASELLEHWQLHQTRPPVYPAILLLLRHIVGEAHLPEAIMGVQFSVFVVAVFYFSKIAKLVLQSSRAAFWTTAVFALLPPFSICFNRYILTESLTMSFVIFFVWTLLSRLPELPRWRSALYSGVWLLVLIFLRPVMMCFIPVYIIFWGYVAWRWKQQAIKQMLMAFGMLAVCGSSILIYKHRLFVEYGLEGMSTAAVVNNYFALRDLHRLRPEHTDNPALKAYLDSICDTSPRTPDMRYPNWDEIWKIKSLSSDQEFEDAVNKAMADTSFAYFRFAKINLGYLSKHALLPGLSIIPLPINMSCYLVFMTMALILLIWKCRHIEPWILFLTSAAISGASTIGAMDEWTRLFYPGMPSALLLCSYIFLPAFRAWRKGL